MTLLERQVEALRESVEPGGRWDRLASGFETIILYGKADDQVCKGRDIQAWEAAKVVRGEASRAWTIAEQVYVETQTTHADAIDALHGAECPDCPWDGTTIFPEGSVE